MVSNGSSMELNLSSRSIRLADHLVRLSGQRRRDALLTDITQALAENNIYERIYSEALADPAVQQKILEATGLDIRPVKPGERVGSDWIISEGLKNGETIIVEGTQKVRPGALVNPKPFAPAAKPAAADGAKPAAEGAKPAAKG